MATVLKIKCLGQVHRVVLSQGEVTYESIQDAIRKVHPVSAVDAKYLDDEGDLCTLCPASLSDFVAISAEQNGRKILKLELIAPAPTPMPNPTMANAEQPHGQGNNAGGKCLEESPVAAALQAGIRNILKAFGSKGEGARGHGCGWKGGHGGHCHKLRAVALAMTQLHRSGELNATSAVALAVHFLPKLLKYAARHTEKIDWIVRMISPQLRPALEDLRALVVGTPGLEQCEEPIMKLLTCEDGSGSQVLLALLTALDDLSFESRVLFFQAFYTSLEKPFGEALKLVEGCMPPWTPAVSLVHGGVICDGCDVSPLTGPRFKCKACPNYDLCAECFCNKNMIHGGDCGDHDFDCMPIPFGHGSWMCKGDGPKGKHWFKGAGKGKGKHCGKRRFDEMCTDDAEAQPRRCARVGCTYAATWHASHCCHACSGGKGKHGPKCEQRHMPAAFDGESENKETMTNADCGRPDEAMREPSFDFSFPVVVEDGRRLVIAWNRGDDLQNVAASFAKTHDIQREELPTIEAFLVHASAVSQGDGAKENESMPQETNYAEKETNDVEEAPGAHGSPASSSSSSDTPNEAELQDTAMKLQEMGVGSADVLLELLRNNRGSVQRVLQTFFAS
mmetsp:Transcript_121180/g.342880  ORF Transcript_121180/g.342880 Transcript_121180/m.342880 type:complete len:619 (-) Transcript_121180:223-2079(-)